MAIDTATFEATLDSKIDAATTSNSAQDFLLLAKAVEATNNAVSSSSLRVSNNLSDVASAATARTNLGLGTMAVEASASYATLSSPTFSGTVTIPTANITTFSLGGTAILATADELNYVDGVTSNVQTQLDAKASTGKAIAMAIVFG